MSAEFAEGLLLFKKTSVEALRTITTTMINMAMINDFFIAFLCRTSY